MSDDLVLWLFAAGMTATCLASIGARALRGFSRQALAQVCKERDQLDLLGDILARHDSVALGVESAQVVATAAMILSGGFWAFRRMSADQTLESPRTWLLYGLSGMLLLLAVEILAPRVVVRLWGARFLASTWNLWILLSQLMLPATHAERAVERLLARLLGREQDRPSDELFEEEIRTIFSKGEREGLLEQEAREMIEGVIELGDATVSQIMTPRTDMICLPIGLSLEEAARQVVDSAHTRIPVFDKSHDDIVGVLYVRDLLPELVRPADQPAKTLSEIVRRPFFVPESKPVNALLREFQRNRNHMAVVLDEYGGVSGLVTIEDALEEIVGEIVDEHDDLVPGIRRIDERAAECLARTRIDEVNEQLKTSIPETGEFDTIGGFVFHEFGRIPKRGEQLVWNNVRITVLDVARRRVERVRIEVLDPAPSQAT